MAGTDVAHIMCGDFNSNCSSPAYQLMLDGELSEESLSLLRTVKSLQPSDDAVRERVLLCECKCGGGMISVTHTGIQVAYDDWHSDLEVK